MNDITVYPINPGQGKSRDHYTRCAITRYWSKTKNLFFLEDTGMILDTAITRALAACLGNKCKGYILPNTAIWIAPAPPPKDATFSSEPSPYNANLSNLQYIAKKVVKIEDQNDPKYWPFVAARMLQLGWSPLNTYFTDAQDIDYVMSYGITYRPQYIKSEDGREVRTQYQDQLLKLQGALTISEWIKKYLKEFVNISAR